MPGASGASSGPRLARRRGRSRARARSRRAAARPAAAGSGVPRNDTMVDSTPTLRRAAIDDQVDAAVEIGAHMLGERRRDVAGPIGRGRDHRLAERLQQVARDRVVRHAHRDRVRARRSRAPTPGSPSAFGSTSVSGPGQNTPASSFASSEKRASAQRRASVRHMRDQRIEARAALGGIKPRDRRAVGGVGAEAVDRLGRERHEPAVGRARARPPRSRRGSRRGNVSSRSTGMMAFRIGRRAATLGRDLHPSRDETNDLPRAGRRHRLHAQARRRACKRALDARALRRPDRGRGRRRAGGGRASSPPR